MRNRTVQGIVAGIFCAGLALYMTPVKLAAEETESLPAQDLTGTQEQSEPEIFFAPEGSYFFGYRFVSQEDSLKAAEYVFPDPSITFGIDLLAAPLPHRYHLSGEFLNKYDFYADGGYAYKDLLMFRNILVGIHHNLDHFDYDFSGEPPSLVYEDRNRGDKYSVDYVNNLFFARLKAPDFPFHAFIKERYVEREGEMEQRFLLGRFGNLNKVSETRSIEWKSNALTLGANSHIGPLELEYAYDEIEFDPGSGNILYDLYPLSTSGSAPRPADIYPHNVVPETEASGNTIKMHTSYTGGIVAAATISNLTEKNNYSQVESTLWKGAFDVSWLPDPVLGFFFKYRHKDVDLDNPDTVTLAGTANVLSYPVRQGLSYKRDNFSVSARYKPLSLLSLFSTYQFSHLERENVDEWLVLPDRTDIHSINLAAHSRPLDNLKLKAIYDYKYYDSPAYNTDPDNSNQLRLTATYLPVPWMTAYVDYILSLADRNDLRYLNSTSLLLLDDGERNVHSDRFLASLSFMVSPKATITGSWAYNKWDVDQDLAFSKRDLEGSRDLPFLYGAPYTDTSNSFSLSLHYIPQEDITIIADVTYTVSEGECEPLYPLVSYAEVDAAETVFSVEVAKKLPRDWEVGVKFYADNYDDRSGDLLDGELFVTTLTLKRHF